MIDEQCGGAERFTAALAMELSRQSDFEVMVCATRHLSEQFRSNLHAAGVKTVALGRKHKWDVHRLFKLRRILKKNNVEILHTHKFGSNAWGTLFGRISRVPIIIAHEHTWSYKGHPIRRLIDGQFIGRFADVFIAVSDEDAQRMVGFEKVPAGKVRVLPTASGAGAGGEQPWNIREKLGLTQDVEIVSVAAMMRPQKALNVLIEAMQMVVASRSSAHLVLIGDGPCRAEWEAYAADLNIADHVHFLGVRDNVAGLLAESDCAALSSDYEGMPLFVLECLGSGTPVIATDVGAVRRLVQHGQNGYLVPPRNPRGMADAILAVLADPVARDLMGKASLRIADRYTIDSVSVEFEHLYYDLLGQRRLTS